MAPVLPWEVIERVVDQSCDDSGTLRNFSLTCRQLRPRSISYIFCHFDLKTRDKVFAICEYLLRKPHLRPLVRSIAVHPSHFLPCPLLRVLHNLTECTFSTEGEEPLKTTTFHSSTLACCRLIGMGIRKLFIQNVVFPTLLSFSQVLLGFKNLEDLAFSRVDIQQKGVGLQHEQIKHLSRRIRLRNLVVSVVSYPLEGMCILPNIS